MSGPHIESRDGVLFLDGTRFKLVQHVQEHLHSGWAPEQNQREHRTLTLGQIYSGLAYYYEHKEEIDLIIRQRQARREALLPVLSNSELQERLRSVQIGPKR